MPGQRCAVADQQELPFGAGQGHVHPPHVAQKADFSARIRANQRDRDGLFFAALKTIDAVDLQARRGQPFAQQPHLGRVGRDHRDVGGRQTGLQQRANLPREEFRLAGVAPAFAVRLLLLVEARPGRVDKFHGRLRQRRGRHAGQVGQHAAADRSVGLQLAVVKLAR